MSKYYVTSGTLRFVGMALNEVQAVQLAIAKCNRETMLGRLIMVNEQGFSRFHKGDILFDTVMLLESMGV